MRNLMRVIGEVSNTREGEREELSEEGRIASPEANGWTFSVTVTATAGVTVTVCRGQLGTE